MRFFLFSPKLKIFNKPYSPIELESTNSKPVSELIYVAWFRSYGYFSKMPKIENFCDPRYGNFFGFFNFLVYCSQVLTCLDNDGYTYWSQVS